MDIERIACRLAAIGTSAVLLGALGCQSSGSSSNTATSDAAPSAQPASNRSALADNRDYAGLSSRVEDATIRHADWAELGYRWDWAARPLVSSGEELQHVDFGDRVIITQDTGSWLTVLDTATGRREWTLEAANNLSTFMGNAVIGNDVLFSASRAQVYGFELRTGNTLLSMSPTRVISSRPLVVGPIMIAGSPADRVQALRVLDNAGNALTGSLREGLPIWEYRVNGTITATPVLMNVDDQDIVAVVSDGGDVLFLRPSSGATTGRAKIAGGVSVDPVTDGEVLYVASLDQSVYAYTTKGERLWRRRTGDRLTNAPVYHEFAVILTIPSEGLTSLSAFTGEPQWVNDQLQGEVIATRAGDLIVWDQRRRLLSRVQASTGDIIASFGMPDFERVIAPDLGDGPIYGITDRGAIIAFRTR
ncbi:MAG: PQQ-binding-like beta-propeller repeat protein [Planctomycetota bacterium]